MELIIDSVLVFLERIQGRDHDAAAELLSTITQPLFVASATPFFHQVQQPHRWMFVSTGRVPDTSEFFGTAAAAILVLPYALCNPESDRSRNYGGSSEALLSLGLT